MDGGGVLSIGGPAVISTFLENFRAAAALAVSADVGGDRGRDSSFIPENGALDGIRNFGMPSLAGGAEAREK